MHIPEIDRHLERARSGCPVFETDSLSLAIFTPDLAQAVDAENTKSLRFSGTQIRSVGQDENTGVMWCDIAHALRLRTNDLQTIYTGQKLGNLFEREFISRSGSTIELPKLMFDVVIPILVPLIMNDLSERSKKYVVNYLDYVFTNQFYEFSPARRLRGKLQEFRAGRCVLMELRSDQRGSSSDYASTLQKFQSDIGIHGVSYLTQSLFISISTAPAATASCLVYELMSHEYWRKEVEKEWNKKVFDADGRLRMREIPATVAVVREVLRLWPFPLLTRRVSTDNICAKELNLERGHLFDLSAYVQHRMPEFWPEAEQFKPERWMEKAKIDNAAFVPFGFKTRTCIGASIGFQTLILLAGIAARRLRIEPSSDNRIQTETLALPRKCYTTVL